MFDRIAPTYDFLNHLLSAGIDVRWRKKAVRALGRRRSVLDLCAGTMDLTAMIEAPRIVAADFAAQMLERGKKKAPRAELVVADALALPFEAGTFDGVICGFGMRNLADVKKGIREVYRVLARGGSFVTLEFFRPVRARARAFHAAYANVVLPALGGVVSGDREAYAYLARSMQGFLTRAEYEDALREAGFHSVRGEDLTLGVASLVVAS
jgi:ubiquinone/menaquinone biosynthesis methyltransferase